MSAGGSDITLLAPIRSAFPRLDRGTHAAVLTNPSMDAPVKPEQGVLGDDQRTYERRQK
jgi:hypothetical protein